MQMYFQWSHMSLVVLSNAVFLCLSGFKATKSYEACLLVNQEMLNRSNVTMFASEDTTFTLYAPATTTEQLRMPVLLECDLKKEIQKVNFLVLVLCMPFI